MSNLTAAKNAITNAATTQTTNYSAKIAPTPPMSIAPTHATRQLMDWNEIRAELTRIGTELEYYRVQQNMTKREISRRSNMSPKTVGYVMKGWTQNIHKYIEVANALGLTIKLEATNTTNY